MISFLLVVAGPLDALVDVLESNNLIVSLTRDLRSPEVGLTGPVIGEALTLLALTGLGLALSFDSSLFGNEIGRGIRDLLETEEDGLLNLIEVVVVSSE
jgi:hypothetical protein